jgi:hypothetical protein
MNLKSKMDTLVRESCPMSHHHFRGRDYGQTLPFFKGFFMAIIAEPNSAKSLIEIVQGLKINTFKWAKVWTLNGTPENRYPNEHHVITQALVLFRTRYLSVTADEQLELKQFFQQNR